MFPQSLETPLDVILSCQVASGYEGDRSKPIDQTDAHLQLLNVPDPVDMFLTSLGNSPTSDKNKTLLILDFVSKVVPDEEKNVIQIGKNAKLSVSLSRKRPKLSEISISEWNLANCKIMYHLIEFGQLPTYYDIKSYLEYSVKINHLASKFSWHSVLQYDEEFRIAQNKFLFPWTHDNMHMHSVLLNSRHVLPSHGKAFRFPFRPSNPPSDVVDETQDGRTICKKFNRFKGCNSDRCSYLHVCNRKSLAGIACALPHPGFQQSSKVSQS